MNPLLKLVFAVATGFALVVAPASAAPAQPALSAAPNTVSSVDNPTISGSAESGSSVSLYRSPDCTGTATPLSAAALAAGVQEIVPHDTTTSFSAKATDGANNTSACSPPLAYTNDSTAPVAPRNLTTDPASPSNSLTPTLSGSAEHGSAVSLYRTADCTGTPTSLTAAELAAGITQSVDPGTTTTFGLTATDAAGNTSACATIAYTHKPQVAESPPPPGTVDKINPTVGMLNPPNGAVYVQQQAVRVAYSCADETSLAACTANVVNGSLLDTSKVGKHTVSVSATDGAGNSASASSTYIVLAPGKVTATGKPSYNLKKGRLTIKTGLTAACLDKGPVCAGTLTLTGAKTKKLATQGFKVAGGQSSGRTIVLSKAQTKKLLKARRDKLTLAITMQRGTPAVASGRRKLAVRVG